MYIAKTIILFVILILSIPTKELKAQNETVGLSLKDAFSGKFKIGAALNLKQIYERDEKATALLVSEFNSITAENCMKAMYLQPIEGEFNFEDADRFVALGEKYGLELIGHTLIWHSQAPKWFFTDQEGKEVSRAILIQRMQKHIHTVVSRYKGRIKGWDVVNESILDNGDWRQSKFYQIIGEDFVELAFQFAHEADPKAELYYNDYSMFGKGKREAVVRMASNLLDKGLKIHGIGMQGHLGLDYPSVREFEESILAFSRLGIQVMITELDMSVLPMKEPNQGAEVSNNYEYEKKLNPYTEGLPSEVEKRLANRYTEFFDLFIKHHDKISRVTMWGLTDADSWKNNWPIRGRTDYPLLFDRKYEAKPFVKELIQKAKIDL
ncbi:endo-1,4-beta-xylanase [Sphingobacterium endophyticum]|uniref:endo-1,4-beta-xylanase n=1 Tax=Sphingobacterium endophyticum TaxID=2546448 RepID=UPI0012E2CC7A|nr:endo-1,4-beta-xylanase [Sphingobacterium endophyticum]